jgi:hypothetical protein
MKIELQTKTTVKGYSLLFGIHHSRIKARSKKISTNVHSQVIDYIKKRDGNYTMEYRLVKEPKGYIFRCSLGDTGINGHHKLMKEAIVGALRWVEIFIDEKFEHEELPEFQKRKAIHQARENNCRHEKKHFEKRYECQYCPTCDTAFYKEETI